MKKVQLLFALIFSTSLVAQEYTHFTEAEGLINNSVNCLTIDQNQNVWFGTNNGVSMFDGVNWSGFSTDLNPELVSNSITAIFASTNGTVWFGTDFGINRFDGASWDIYTEEDGLGDNRISSITEDSNGNIWIGEKNGISKFDGVEWTSYGMDDGLPFGGVNEISFDSNNDLWLANSIFGMIHFDGTDFTTYNTNAGLVSNSVRTIEIDEEDNKWIGTAQGITVLNANNNVVDHHTMMLLLPEPDTLNPVVDIAFDSQGNVWTGIYVDYLVTVGGVAAWNGDSWTGFTDDEELVGPVVRALAVDVNDAIWVATSSGVTKISEPVLSIPQVYTYSEMSVYPNPATTEVTIDFDTPEEITLTNSLGQRVLTKKMNIGLNVLDVSSLATGLYFIKSENSSFKKVLIK
jgi:two-component system sensor histidine kinase ChiS